MKKRFRHSFTLVELIVAMAVFSLMMLMMMQFFSDTQTLWSRSEEKNNMYADARIAMDLMSSALQSVYYQESGADVQHDYHQERFFISATADSNTSGRIAFPVNLSRESPLYPSATGAHTDFAKAFYISFWLDNHVLRVANDNAATSFTGDIEIKNCNTDNQAIVGNITELSFRLFKSNFTVLNSGAYANQRVFPHSVQNTMKMMPKDAFDTWTARVGGGSENAEQRRYRQENEYEFVRIVYLGVY